MQPILEKRIFIPISYNRPIEDFRTNHIILENPKDIKVGTIIGIYLDDNYSKLPIKIMIYIQGTTKPISRTFPTLEGYINNEAKRYKVTKEEIMNLYDFPFNKEKLL